MKVSRAPASRQKPEIKELRASRGLAFEYARAAVESLHDEGTRGSSLTMLRALAEAYGGIAAVAAKAGISRESLYRSLSPKGNPTLKTLIAVLNTMGLRLTVVPEKKKTRKGAAAKKPGKSARTRAAA